MSDENVGRIEREDVSGILSKKIPKLAEVLKVPIDRFAREYVVQEAPTEAKKKGGQNALITRIEKALPTMTREEMLSIVKLMRRGLHAIRPNINRITIRETTSGR